MTDRDDLHHLRIPTVENPLRILTSACLLGVACGVEGTTYGDYPSVLQLMKYKTAKLFQFCPEDFSFGTPREMCDIYGGNGDDVLDGKAKVLTASGIDWTEGMIRASEKMLEVAKKNEIELCVMMPARLKPFGRGYFCCMRKPGYLLRKPLCRKQNLPDRQRCLRGAAYTPWIQSNQPA